MGLEWIFRMSRRACSLGSSISTTQWGIFNHSNQTAITSLIPHTLTDFAVEPAGPQQGRVQGVGSVGGHDHLDSVEGVEAVHLVQQLTGRQQDTSISRLQPSKRRSGHLSFTPVEHLHQTRSTMKAKLFQVSQVYGKNSLNILWFRPDEMNILFVFFRFKTQSFLLFWCIVTYQQCCCILNLLFFKI